MSLPDRAKWDVTRTSALIDDVRKGSEPALEELLVLLLPSVRARLARLLGTGPDLDDAVQDALIALATSLPQFEGRSSLDTYVHRITTRVAYRYFGRLRQPSMELVPEPPEQIDPESRAMDREVLRRLRTCLDRMPKNRRMAFLLCAVEGLSAEDAAAIEETTPQAVRSRLMHARREVARLMASDPYVRRMMER